MKVSDLIRELKRFNSSDEVVLIAKDDGDLRYYSRLSNMREIKVIFPHVASPVFKGQISSRGYRLGDPEFASPTEEDEKRAISTVVLVYDR